MFSDEFLDEIFSKEEMHKIPLGCQSTVIHVLEEIITEKVRANYDTKLSELLSE